MCGVQHRGNGSMCVALGEPRKNIARYVFSHFTDLKIIFPIKGNLSVTAARMSSKFRRIDATSNELSDTGRSPGAGDLSFWARATRAGHSCVNKQFDKQSLLINMRRGCECVISDQKRTRVESVCEGCGGDRVPCDASMCVRMRCE